MQNKEMDVKMITLSQLKKFFARPSINKSGFCKEYGISRAYVNEILRGDKPITKSFSEKIKPILERFT